MAQFQTGHTHNTVRHGRLSHRLGDQIEGRHIVAAEPKKEPELIRQKPPRSVRDAKPASKSQSKTRVRCRQITQAGRPKVVFLHEAKLKFHSHHMKCQECMSRPLCAGD